MSGLTVIQCHYARGILNQMFRVGRPCKSINLAKYGKLACLRSIKRHGNVTERVSNYRKQDWRFFILKMLPTGFLTHMPCITPSANFLSKFIGIQVVKRKWEALGETERSVSGLLNTLPDGYGAFIQNDISVRKTVSGLWPLSSYSEAGNAF